eukprot:512319-Pleurochrysis_carterae.AAC.1
MAFHLLTSSPARPLPISLFAPHPSHPLMRPSPLSPFCSCFVSPPPWFCLRQVCEEFFSPTSRPAARLSTAQSQRSATGCRATPMTGMRTARPSTARRRCTSWSGGRTTRR